MSNRDINFSHDGIYYGDGFSMQAGLGKLHAMMGGGGGFGSIYASSTTTYTGTEKAGLDGYEGGGNVPTGMLTTLYIDVSSQSSPSTTDSYYNANSYYPYSNGSGMGSMYAGIGTIYAKPTITNDNNYLLKNYASALSSHQGIPVSIGDWSKRYKNMSLNQIRNENSSIGDFNSKIGGPFSRWVQDPLVIDKMVFIDMKHFLVAITASRWMGNFNEWYQAQRNNPSAHNPQDYYSNNLGYAFNSYYINEINPYRYGSQVTTNRNIAVHIQNFLTNANLRSYYLNLIR